MAEVERAAMDAQTPAQRFPERCDRLVRPEGAEAPDDVVARDHGRGPVLAQHHLDLVEVDAQAEHLGDALAPAGQEEEALVIEIADVARAEDAVPARRPSPRSARRSRSRA